ncbi:GntR family transcriptional regulator [Microlunatus speluncae]|uniref:GntR family transcriptional regulator n=1 Tax=Microlunatus speluncae TaxID=2594267 RepID=UPI0012668592|nr:GntR family transcriptional regulator [Microlunatus speluncae]
MGEAPDDERTERTSVSDRIYERLLAMLIDGEIEPGQRIRVDAISRQLGVSQTPVRESLLRLEAEDLVEKKHLIGYSATPRLSAARFEDLFEARFLIEPFCSGLAAGRHQRGQIETITRLAAEMRDGYESGELSYGAFARSDAELHRALIDATGNGYFSEIFAKLHAHLQLFRLLRDSSVTEDALTEHDRIITAIRTRDSEAATAAMAAHLAASRSRLRKAFDQHQQQVREEPSQAS